MPIQKPLELIVLTATTAYLFWRWADHASHGSGFWFYAVFNGVLGIVFLVLLTLCIRTRIRYTPARGLIATAAFSIAICFLPSLIADVDRPRSKEMFQLVSSQPNLIPETQSQWLEGAVLRIRRELWTTILLACLVGCYILRLPTKPGDRGERNAPAAPSVAHNRAEQ